MWPEAGGRDGGTSDVGSVSLRSAQMMGQEEQPVVPREQALNLDVTFSSFEMRSSSW